MTSLKDALQFPFSDKFFARRLLIGGILIPIPLIFFFPFGYLMRHFEAYLKGHEVDRLPEWDDLPTILSYGFFAFVILVGYLFIPFLIFSLGVKMWGGWAGYIFLAAGFITAIWVMSYYPMGLAAYIMKGHLGAAFRKSELYDYISGISTSYYHTYLLGILLFFLGGNSPFVLFFIFIVLCQLFGKTISPVFAETPQAPAQTE